MIRTSRVAKSKRARCQDSGATARQAAPGRRGQSRRSSRWIWTAFQPRLGDLLATDRCRRRYRLRRSSARSRPSRQRSDRHAEPDRTVVSRAFRTPPYRGLVAPLRAPRSLPSRGSSAPRSRYRSAEPLRGARVYLSKGEAAPRPSRSGGARSRTSRPAARHELEHCPSALYRDPRSLPVRRRSPSTAPLVLSDPRRALRRAARRTAHRVREGACL